MKTLSVLNEEICVNGLCRFIRLLHVHTMIIFKELPCWCNPAAVFSTSLQLCCCSAHGTSTPDALSQCVELIQHKNDIYLFIYLFFSGNLLSSISSLGVCPRISRSRWEGQAQGTVSCLGAAPCCAQVVC